MLSTLAHGELEGLAELMALNLYLNNKFGTVLIHKIPVDPITSPDDFAVAKKHMQKVHSMILDKLYTFWNTWCSDIDVVAKHQYMYKSSAFVELISEMEKNTKDTDDFIRGLNVSDHVVDLDFDPKRIALTDFVNHIISSRSMPTDMLADMQLKSFEISYEFNPHAVYEYQMSVFRTIYTCFYWTTITHLKLSVRLIDNLEKRGVQHYQTTFIVNFVRYMRPLTVFDINRIHFVATLSTDAARNLNRLLAFMLKIYRNSRNTRSKNWIPSSRPAIQKFVDLLSADMKTMFNMEVPDSYFDNLSYENNTLKLMQSNYRAFVRLVAATSGFIEDQINVIKLKKFAFFSTEAIAFDGI
jgi:hypothetical protein